jgi:hypothetical protein
VHTYTRSHAHTHTHTHNVCVVRTANLFYTICAMCVCVCVAVGGAVQFDPTNDGVNDKNFVHLAVRYNFTVSATLIRWVFEKSSGRMWPKEQFPHLSNYEVSASKSKRVRCRRMCT